MRIRYYFHRVTPTTAIQTIDLHYGYAFKSFGRLSFAGVFDIAEPSHNTRTSSIVKNKYFSLLIKFLFSFVKVSDFLLAFAIVLLFYEELFHIKYISVTNIKI